MADNKQEQQSVERVTGSRDSISTQSITFCNKNPHTFFFFFFSPRIIDTDSWQIKPAPNQPKSSLLPKTISSASLNQIMAHLDLFLLFFWGGRGSCVFFWIVWDYFFFCSNTDILKTTKETERDLFQSAVEPFLLEDFASRNILKSASKKKKTAILCITALKTGFFCLFL